MKNYILILLASCLITSSAFAQDIVRKKARTEESEQSNGTDAQAVEEPSFTIDGYVDTYYLFSTDSLSRLPDRGEQFSTFGPRVNQFGLNVARLSSAYTSDRIRGTISLFYGDVNYSWDPEFNMLQEANVGVRIAKGLWFDMGIFSTHIGTEVLLPRDNMMSSLALGTYHEPFFMKAGVLSYDFSDKFSAKLVLANDYYTMARQQNANSPAYGLGLTFKPMEGVTISYTNLIDDQAQIGQDTTQWRFYNNLYVAYTTDKLLLAAGADFAHQENAKFSDEGKLEAATAFNFEVEGKYYFTPKAAAYGRFDHFFDEYGILSPTIETRVGHTQGLIASSITAGGELKPTDQSYIRLEGRYLWCDTEQHRFKDLSGNMTHDRFSVLFTFGFSFRSKNLLK